jgi:SAM-dependent methyltransferase
MDNRTADTLRKINNDFYRDNASSFSATRAAPWPGWRRCLEILGGNSLGIAEVLAAPVPVPAPVPPSTHAHEGLLERQNLLVLDLACGNLRFEAFLVSALPETIITFYAVDTCDALVPQVPGVDYQSLDILAILQDASCLNNRIDAPPCDLSVSFGLMHHIPLQEHRAELLASLIRQTCPGGYVIVSLWQFLNDPVLARKAQTTHERALKDLAFWGLGELDDHDYLLGWQDIPKAYRYCHSFTESEIDSLVESVAHKASLVSRFTSDGKTDNLNTYLILKVL